MSRKTAGPEIERLIQLLARLPGLGHRSARKAALALLKRRADLLEPLAAALGDAAARIKPCSTCGNLDTVDPCTVCADPRRDQGLIVVVEEMGDLWALERAGVINGVYHVLGGHLSPLDGIGPDRLNIPRLIERARPPVVKEVLLALNETVRAINRALPPRAADPERRQGVRATAGRAGRWRTRLPGRGHARSRDPGTQIHLTLLLVHAASSPRIAAPVAPPAAPKPQRRHC